MGHVESKTRSLGQICSKSCSPSRDHSFASVFIIFYQNVSLGDNSVKFEHGSCWVKNEVTRSNFFRNFVHPLEATVLLKSYGTLPESLFWRFLVKFE